MDTDKLRYFCAIAESGSLTKAAGILGVSHSGLSKAMSALQSEIGANLFQPNGRGLELTERGEALLPDAKEILERLERLKRGQAAEPRRNPRISLPEAISIALACKLANEFKEGLDLLELDSGQMEVELIARRIDFGVTFVPFPHEDLDYLKIARAELGVFRALPSRDEPSFVIPASELKDNPLSIKSRDGWPFDVPRTVRYRAGSLSTALGLAENSGVAIFMPKFVAKSRPALKEVPWSPLPARARFRDVFLVKRKQDPESQEMKRLSKLIRHLR